MNMATKIKYLNDTLKIQIEHKNEFKKALESTEHFESLKDTVNQITGMLVSQGGAKLT